MPLTPTDIETLPETIYGFSPSGPNDFNNALIPVSAQISGRRKMPQKVVCSECGTVLYEGDILKSPRDILKKHNGRCPECDKKLNFSSDKVNVTPAKG